MHREPRHGPDVWFVTLPGQPPSGNHMYERSRGGGVHKKPGIETYQVGVTTLVRDARPSGWRPEGLVLVTYSYFLKRPIDCTNAQKVIEDAIAVALRPEDPLYDRMFIPQTWAKEFGHREPFVRISLEAW